MPTWRTTTGDFSYFHLNVVMVVLLTMMLLLNMSLVVVNKTLPAWRTTFGDSHYFQLHVSRGAVVALRCR